MTDEYEASYTIQGKTFYYDTREFTESEIKAMDLTAYLNDNEEDAWTITKMICEDTNGEESDEIVIY